MKARFLIILDSHASDNLTKEALDALGLEQGKDYLILDADVSVAAQLLRGDVGERPVDATQLLMFTGLFSPGGSMSLAKNFAEAVVRVNPAAKIYVRSTIEISILGPVFAGFVEKEFGKHPNLQAIIRREFGL
jgi:hypothetical protein